VKAKPRGPKYRNLTPRGGVIYYQRRVGKRRLKISAKTDDWDDAAAFRDLYEAKKGIAHGVAFLPADPPRLSAFVTRYLAEDVAHLAPTTVADRKNRLRESGPILRGFGHLRLDAITAPMLREWWGREIEASEARGAKTGREYVNTLSSVLQYAEELGLLESSPIPAFRAMLRRQRRTQRGRAESDPTRDIQPIVDSAAIGRLVEGARAESTEALAYVLLLLDAGLRDGEARGLRWGCIAWGEDEHDRGRHLRVEASSSGKLGILGPTKSGRARSVALSRRLRRALEALRAARAAEALAAGRPGPGPDALVLEGVNPEQFYGAPWSRICKRASVGHVRRKDLRDTFASWLLSLGVQLAYVSKELGHADVAVTARHYAKWCAGDVYRAPLPLESGEVPADLLARLEKWHQSDTTERQASAAASESAATKSEGSRAVARASRGGPPGTRTRNQRVKSPGAFEHWRVVSAQVCHSRRVVQ